MFEILSYGKETENKYRWDNVENGVKFSVYIPKWRVPVPRPERIYVDILDSENIMLKNQCSRAEYEENSKLKNNKIYAEVKKVEELGQTVRFDPIGSDSTEYEIGSPYIPYDLFPDKTIKRLLIIIEWK
jgi:hypothetical protein